MTPVGCGGGGAAVLQAEGLEAHLVVLSQDGPHLQAVVKGAGHMEGHDTGGHGALEEEEGEEAVNGNKEKRPEEEETEEGSRREGGKREEG